MWASPGVCPTLARDTGCPGTSWISQASLWGRALRPQAGSVATTSGVLPMPPSQDISLGNRVPEGCGGGTQAGLMLPCLGGSVPASWHWHPVDCRGPCAHDLRQSLSLSLSHVQLQTLRLCLAAKLGPGASQLPGAVSAASLNSGASSWLLRGCAPPSCAWPFQLPTPSPPCAPGEAVLGAGRAPAP